MYNAIVRRNTDQRQSVLRSLQQTGRPLSARELHSTARKSCPGIGIATIYRTVKSLLTEGDVSLVELPGEPPRYEFAGKRHHHHFSCRECGKVYEIEGCRGNFKSLTPPGFRLQAHDMILTGTCASCVS